MKIDIRSINDLCENKTIINDFLIDDDTFNCNLVKEIKISFNNKKHLEELHTHITEYAPYEYNGETLSLVKNYSSSKAYSKDGVYDLKEPKQKLLKFFLTDNSFIFFKRNDEMNKEQILFGVTHENDPEKRINGIEEVLVKFLEDFSLNHINNKGEQIDEESTR